MYSNFPLLLISGMGFCPEIFQDIIPKNRKSYAVGPLTQDSLGEMERLLAQTALKGCHVLGWSLGGLLALELKRRMPHVVRKIILIAVRDGFPSQEIEEQKKAAESDLSDYLRRLYKKCFIGQKEAYKWFQDTLQPDFLQRIPLKDVLWGLKYLSSHSPETEKLNGEELLMCYGTKDIIAPPNCMPKMPVGAKIYVLETGHLPFLHQDFLKIMMNFLTTN